MATKIGKQSEVDDRHAESIEASEKGTAAPSVSGVEDTLSQTDPEPEKVKQETPVAAPTAGPAAPLPDMPKPPNGGLTAWLQVFGAFWVYFNTWCVYHSRVADSCSSLRA